MIAQQATIVPHRVRQLIERAPFVERPEECREAGRSDGDAGPFRRPLAELRLHDVATIGDVAAAEVDESLVVVERPVPVRGTAISSRWRKSTERPRASSPTAMTHGKMAESQEEVGRA